METDMPKWMWFRVSSDKIEKFERISSTPKFITFINQYGRQDREAIHSQWANWFPVFQDAKNFLLNKYRKKIDDYYDKINYCEEKLEMINNYKP